MGELLAKRKISYRWIGTKLPGLRRDISDNVGDIPTIVCVRDVATWSAKNKIVMEHYDDRNKNVVPTIVDYVQYFIHLCGLKNRVVIRLEDLVSSRLDCLSRIARFLGLEEDVSLFDAWWDSDKPAQ